MSDCVFLAQIVTFTNYPSVNSPTDLFTSLLEKQASVENVSMCLSILTSGVLN